MLRYKTISIPARTIKIRIRHFKKEILPEEKAEDAVDPIRAAIQNEAKIGWTLHSIQALPQKVKRKKHFFELILGWIPILGNWLFPLMKRECKLGVTWYLYVITFVREV